MNRILVILTFVMGTWSFIFAQNEIPLDNSFIFVDENGNEIVDGSIITVYGLNNSGEMSIPLKVKNVSGKKVAVSMYETIDEIPNGDWTTCAFGNCMILSQSSYSAKGIVDADYNAAIETAWVPSEGQYATWQATLQIHIFNTDTITRFGQIIEVAGTEVIGYGPQITINFVYNEDSSNNISTYSIESPLIITAKVSNYNRFYGDENPDFAITYTGFIDGDDESCFMVKPTASTPADKRSNIGTYPITISGGVSTKYSFKYEPGQLKIEKAPLSAKVNDATKVYGTQNPAFSIDYYGLKNEETVPAWSSSPTFHTNATQSSAVGTYEMKAVNGVPVNYDLGSITPGTLNITPAPLTIKANDAARQYYSEEPDFSFTCNGLVNGDNEDVLSPKPTLSTSATKTSNVGEYEIKVSGASSQNYSISFVNGTLTIIPRTLMASVGNYERIYNEENPVFEVNYSGFVGNEDETVLLAKATASTIATKTSDVGTYPINVSGGDADNYVFTYTPGTLTINKAEQEIVWEQEFENIQIGDQIELLAYATSGLPIDYTISNNSLASTYHANGKVYLDCLEEGTLVIRALQEGNNNYYAAVRKSKNVTIGDSSGIETVSTSMSDAPVYDLMGNKVKVMVKGRIYIQNGKKFVAR